MDVFIEKHRILSLRELAMAYVATNISLGYLANFLALDSETDLETLLSGLGNSIIYSFLFPGCKLVAGEVGKKILPCRDALPLLKKAKLKVKGANK